MEAPSESPCVLVLGGWSPGPIPSLPLQGYRVLQPPIPMPPISNWMTKTILAWSILLGAVVWIGLTTATALRVERGASLAPKLVFLGTLLVGLVGFRLLVMLVVRSSLKEGVQICRDLLRDYPVVAVLGFSWGAALWAEVLAESAADDELPPSILMVPPTLRVAQCAWIKDAAVRLHERSAGVSSTVMVVHASEDQLYCPHTDRWEGINGVHLEVLRDTHILAQRRSKRHILELWTKMMRPTKAVPKEQSLT